MNKLGAWLLLTLFACVFFGLAGVVINGMFFQTFKRPDDLNVFVSSGRIGGGLVGLLLLILIRHRRRNAPAVEEK